VTALGVFTPKPVNVSLKPGTAYSNGPESEALREIIIHDMTVAAAGASRGLQKEIGPSEIGEPCARQVAFKVAGVEKNPSWQDPFPSIRGVAMHSWMEENLPKATWELECSVDCGRGVVGTSDAYHKPSLTVVDWKFLGATQHGEWLRGYLSTKYRVQAHTYGNGWAARGYRVDRVALAIFGVTKTLQDLYVWSEPWQPAIAEQALVRLDHVRSYVAATAASNSNRAPLLQVPATPGGGCFFCPYKGRADQGLCCDAR
jgi:hypothetical protein